MLERAGAKVRIETEGAGDGAWHEGAVDAGIAPEIRFEGWAAPVHIAVGGVAGGETPCVRSPVGNSSCRPTTSWVRCVASTEFCQ